LLRFEQLKAFAFVEVEAMGNITIVHVEDSSSTSKSLPAEDEKLLTGRAARLRELLLRRHVVVVLDVVFERADFDNREARRFQELERALFAPHCAQTHTTLRK
jgi:hypothetical protein